MEILIIGQGGHSKVIRDIILSNEEHQIVGYLDDKYEDVTIRNNTYFGPIVSARQMIGYFHEVKFVIGVGNNRVRKLIVEKLNLPSEYYVTLMHKSSVVSSSAKIGDGTVLMAYTVINADTQIGHHTIINTRSVIEHDNKLGDFVHVSPNATLTGSVKIEEGVHIGAGATIIPGVEIGAWTTIGAGATVINNIPGYSTAVGIPAKIIIKNVAEGVINC